LPDTMTDWAAWSREAVAEMNRRNTEWIARYGLGSAPYRWDLGRATIRFERGSERIIADLCLIGSVSEHEGTFLWAWANEATPAAATVRLDRVRRFGEEHDLPLLTTPESPGGRAEGLEMLAIAGRIQDAAGALVDRDGDVTVFFTLHRFRVEEPT
jgi:uncharacterized protein DUF6882